MQVDELLDLVAQQEQRKLAASQQTAKAPEGCEEVAVGQLLDIDFETFEPVLGIEQGV